MQFFYWFVQDFFVCELFYYIYEYFGEIFVIFVVVRVEVVRVESFEYFSYEVVGVVVIGSCCGGGLVFGVLYVFYCGVDGVLEGSVIGSVGGLWCG